MHHINTRGAEVTASAEKYPYKPDLGYAGVGRVYVSKDDSFCLFAFDLGHKEKTMVIPERGGTQWTCACEHAGHADLINSLGQTSWTAFAENTGNFERDLDPLEQVPEEEVVGFLLCKNAKGHRFLHVFVGHCGNLNYLYKTLSEERLKELLLGARSVSGRNLLHWAAHFDPNDRFSTGGTARGCYHWSKKVAVNDVFFGEEFSIEMLHDLACCQDHEGNTPLHIAAEKANLRAVEKLVQCTTFRERIVKNKAGYTALDIAEEKEYHEIVARLRPVVKSAGETLAISAPIVSDRLK